MTDLENILESNGYNDIKKVGNTNYCSIYIIFRSERKFIGKIYSSCQEILSLQSNSNLNEIFTNYIERLKIASTIPGILKFDNCIHRDDQWIFLFDHFSGLSLEDFFLSNPDTNMEELLVLFLKQIVNILSSLHKLHIIYGNISIRNIFLSEDKLTINLLEPGLIHIYSNYISSYYNNPKYLPPEIINNSSICDKSSDIWMIGMTVLDIIFGSDYLTKYSIHVNNSDKIIHHDLMKISSKFTHDNCHKLERFIMSCLSQKNNRISIDELINHPFLENYDTISRKYNFISPCRKSKILRLKFNTSNDNINDNQDINIDEVISDIVNNNITILIGFNKLFNSNNKYLSIKNDSAIYYKLLSCCEDIKQDNLDLSLINLSDKDDIYLGSLFDLIKVQIHLVQLNLSNCGLGNNVRYLFQSLKYLSNLYVLNLNMNNMNDSNISDLCNNILFISKLIGLSLGNSYYDYNDDHHIHDKGLALLSHQLKYLPNLENLELWYNRFTCEGLNIFFNSLRFISSLKGLWLGGNKIGDYELELLLKNAKYICQIEGIGLDCNEITNQGVDYLYRHLKYMKNLHQLLLLNNDKINDLGLISKIQKKYNINIDIDIGTHGVQKSSCFPCL